MGFLIQFSDVFTISQCISILLMTPGIHSAPLDVRNTSQSSGVQAYGDSPFFSGPRTTLTDLGEMTMHMLNVLSSSNKDSVINIHGLSELVAVLAKNALMLDNPEEAYKALRQEEIISELKVQLEDKLTALTLNGKEMRTTLEVLETNLTRKLEDYIAKQKQRVACDVYISTKLSMSPGNVIQFDGITHNKGDHYDPTTGHFTCPVSGNYLVSLTLQGQTTKTNVTVNVSGKQVAALVSGDCQITITSGYNRETHNWCSKTFSVTKVVVCSEGEAIFIEAAGSTTTELVGPLNEIPQSQFSVDLLQIMD